MVPYKISCGEVMTFDLNNQWTWLSKKFTFLFWGMLNFPPLLVENAESH